MGGFKQLIPIVINSVQDKSQCLNIEYLDFNIGYVAFNLPISEFSFQKAVSKIIQNTDLTMPIVNFKTLYLFEVGRRKEIAINSVS